MSLRVLFALSLCTLSLSVGMMVYVLGRIRPLERPHLGLRGLRRQDALDGNVFFRLMEPLVRRVGAWAAQLPLVRTRRALSRRLMNSGEWLGLSADELIALVLVSSLAGALMASAVDSAFAMGLGSVALWLGVILGASVPLARVSSEATRRFRQVNRGLPGAIDLAALCMGAGLDFPGALRQIVDKSPDKKDALFEELGRIIQELELGRTRRQALETFAVRVPTDAVRDFVSASVQAEEKGTPIADILRVQAQMLRMRRSVLAEEAAAKAAVMLILPLMLIFISIILVLMGPFVVNWTMRGGF